MASPIEVAPESNRVTTPKPERGRAQISDTVGERMLTVYRLVRLPGAVAAGIGNLVLTFAFDWIFGWLAVSAAGLALIDSIRELRSPRRSPVGTILVDATLLGLTMVAVGLPAVSFAFGLWLVLLTALFATGWWRPFLYGYVALWAVLANLVTWSGEREWTRLEVLVLDWTALLLVGTLVVGLLGIALRRIRAMEAERTYMMGVVGHELVNALTSVTAMASTLRRHGESLGEDQARRIFDSIRAQAQESADIADDLITLARLKQDTLLMSPEMSDAWEETAEVVRRTNESAGTAIQLSDQVVAPVNVDPLRFRQVIRNLLANAINYGGEAIEVMVTTDQDRVLVSVRDDGPGIPVDQVEAVFQPYGRATTDRDYPGSAGLGLWISHRLATEMGGGVSYRRDDPWTVFEVTFPLANSESEAG